MPPNSFQLCLVIGTTIAFAPPSAADERNLTTIVGAGTSVSGSEIDKEVIEECIVELPAPGELSPVADAHPEYFTHINGDIEKNGTVRTFRAAVDVFYVIYQKQLVVVTTNSVERSEPVLKEVGGRFDRSIRFESNPGNGDQFAGQGLTKQYFFSSEQAATDDAMRRAKAWLSQKRTVMCKN